MTATSTSARAPERFQWRVFTSLLVVPGFAVLAGTGIGLYLTPAGRIANWSGWTLGGLTKAQWQSVHMVFGLLFVITAAVHLFFNWRALMSYLRAHATLGRRRRREIGLAGLISAVLLILSIGDVPPVSEVAALRERVANAWSTPALEPPQPHAELLTIARLAESKHIPLDQALAALATDGVAMNPDLTLAAIAESSKTTPQELYRRLEAVTPSDSGHTAAASVPSTGMGWKTLKAVSEELALPVEAVVARLQSAGIAAEPGETLRDIASRNNRHAPDIFALVRGAGPGHPGGQR